MLLLAPERVRFASQIWPQVLSVAFSRHSEGEILAWNDWGPHAVFADAARQSTRIRITMAGNADELVFPAPGIAGDLEIRVREGAGDGGVFDVRSATVLMAITHRLGSKQAPERIIDLVALSNDGRQDPIVITRVKGG